MAGVPMLPPTRTGSLAAARISPASEVVVVLPLAPVMAAMAGAETGCQLDFADYFFAEIARLDQLRGIEGDAGADYDQVLAAKGAVAVAAGLDGDSVLEEEQNFFAKLGFGLGVGDSDTGSAGFEEKGGGYAGFAKADYEYAFVFQVHWFYFTIDASKLRALSRELRAIWSLVLPAIPSRYLRSNSS